MSKTSRPRPFSVPLKEFDNTFETIFGKKEPKPRWVPPPLPTEESTKENNMQVRVKEDASKIGKCGCGRSPTGKCIGWHGLTEEQYNAALEKYMTNQEDANGEPV